MNKMYVTQKGNPDYENRLNVLYVVIYKKLKINFAANNY